MALKPEAGSFFHKIVDAAKKFFLIKMKGFEVDKMVLMTVMMEGTHDDVKRQSANLISVCASHGGLNAGAEAGYRGYFLTYMIAYLRDFGMQYPSPHPNIKLFVGIVLMASTGTS